MRRAARNSVVVATCAVFTTFGLASAAAATRSTSAPQAAAAQCTYTPVLPKLIIVNRPTLNFHTPVRITAAAGADCTSNFSASESLAHRSDKYFLSWLYNSTTASDAVYATTVVPGTYATTASSHSCSVTDPRDGSHPTCVVDSGTTVMKFGGKVSLAATRLTGSKSDTVRFTGRAARYNPNSKSYVTTTVAIQRYYSGAWHTIHTADTHGSHGFAFAYANPRAAHYRAVSAATAAVVGALSGTVTR